MLNMLIRKQFMTTSNSLNLTQRQGMRVGTRAHEPLTTSFNGIDIDNTVLLHMCEWGRWIFQSVKRRGELTRIFVGNVAGCNVGGSVGGGLSEELIVARLS